MTAERPTVSPELIAAMIESTPDRVRRRLDRAPDAAASWLWHASDAGWAVDTGGETVTLPHGHVTRVEQLACTCLLSPSCFHVLACLAYLEVAIVESLPGEQTEVVETAGPDERDDLVEPDEKQRQAARELVRNVAHLLQVGVANAGVVVQSGLLRAVHQCRADGLHRLAGLGLRVAAGTSEFRARAPTSDPAQLALDVADLLETCRHVQSQQAIESFWIGTARRKQMPVRPRRLHGLFAEPIVTRSGFSGATVYFLGEDDHIYTSSDIRPGEAERARDAYLGGIEIGALIQPAKQLARGLYLGTDLTASEDGRLGRGKGIKIVEQGQSTWQAESIQARFRRPLLEQWNAVYAQAGEPADARPAGWDFVFVAGTIVGAVGAQLLFKPNLDTQPIRLAIENENELLYFRENLRMLSHAPGLRLQVIGRMNLNEPRIVSPLAAAQVEGVERNDDEPRFEISQSFAGRICLGFDEVQRHHLKNAQTRAVDYSVLDEPDEQENPLSALRRRWIATMLSGRVSQRTNKSRMLIAETTALSQLGFPTGAALLNTLGSTPLDAGTSGIDTFLAVAIYLRTCDYAMGRARAMLSITQAN
jgi:hypothetical protein